MSTSFPMNGNNDLTLTNNNNNNSQNQETIKNETIINQFWSKLDSISERNNQNELGKIAQNNNEDEEEEEDEEDDTHDDNEIMKENLIEKQRMKLLGEDMFNEIEKKNN
eukprot:CAMPEP_0114383468 /NCGR_PEP_ID=MMETSP0102-20121206/4756_1 /TAXON_ID=38822 ORGANISM="Pteridomonas danica, Strain PT" /NCGR_SAMPLE_ID=MMETSP0102 /ASSEMBLY_ACC=CAM_ASM_000212 /LENGTH=108 /DNA_ID=CAMNT_0001539533 /DNA_START=1679 /DNA_END=2006 /DNA_ORIENTATION=-